MKKRRILRFSYIIIYIAAAILLFTACEAEPAPSGSKAERSSAGVSSQISPEGPSGDSSSDLPSPEDDTLLRFRKDGDGGSIGVWWWNNRHAKDDAERELYLSFLEANRVSEIYLWVGDMTDEEIAVFLRDAGGRGMRVAWLSGDASWILPGVKGGEEFLEKEFFAYQQRAEGDLRFYGLHMDVEPHQLEGFWSEKDKYLAYYAAYAAEVSARVQAAGYEIEWDIPFWFDDTEVTVETAEGERQVRLLPYLAQRADTLCIMSYRDDTEAILSLCEQELAAGEEGGCRIVCGVDCYSEEGEDVSFAEDGKRVMAKQLQRLYTRLSRMEPDGYGVAVHYLNSWYDLKP